MEILGDLKSDYKAKNFPDYYVANLIDRVCKKVQRETFERELKR